MKKYVKIKIKNVKEPLYLSLEKWAKILADERNLAAFTLDNETEWTGRVINKLEVAMAEYDPEYTRKANEPKYVLYRRKSDNMVLQVLEGELPEDFNNYEKL